MTVAEEPPDSDSSRALDQKRRLESVEACYGAARRALRLARVYRLEPGSTGRREAECIDEVRHLRAAIAQRRIEARAAHAVATPGLHKADAHGPRDSAATSKRTA